MERAIQLWLAAERRLSRTIVREEMLKALRQKQCAMSKASSRSRSKLSRGTAVPDSHMDFDPPSDQLFTFLLHREMVLTSILAAAYAPGAERAARAVEGVGESLWEGSSKRRPS